MANKDRSKQRCLQKALLSISTVPGSLADRLHRRLRFVADVGPRNRASHRSCPSRPALSLGARGDAQSGAETQIALKSVRVLWSRKLHLSGRGEMQWLTKVSRVPVFQASPYLRGYDWIQMAKRWLVVTFTSHLVLFFEFSNGRAMVSEPVLFIRSYGTAYRSFCIAPLCLGSLHHQGGHNLQYDGFKAIKRKYFESSCVAL